MSESAAGPTGHDALDALADAFLARRRAGEDVSIESFAVAHPTLAGEIRDLFPTLLAMESVAAAGAIEQIGPYRILRELGRGGMGVVYLAEDSRLSRRVALKVLTPSLAASAQTAQTLLRFRREAEIASHLDHPSICTVYEAGESAGTAWIAMRYVEGETLAQWIERRRAAKAGVTRDDVAAVLRWTEEAARALHEAHEAGLVHRDVKPGNVMIERGTDERGGRAVVLDFGLARPTESAGDATMTQPGALLGTPAYMSPEQILAARYRLDRRTDVYSLGVTLYEALTLRLPFEAATHGQLLQAILTSQADSPRRLNPTVGSDLRVVVETAMDRERERRYATAADFAEDLRRVREHEPIRARPAGPLLRLRRWAQRSPVLATSTAGLFVTLAVGLSVALHLLGQVSDERDAKDSALVQRGASLQRTRAMALADASTVAETLDTTLSLLLAREAVRTSATPQTVSQLQAALGLPEELWTFSGHARDVVSIEPAPDGSRIVTADEGGVVFVLDVATGATVCRLDVNSAAVMGVSWSPDSSTFATMDDTGAVRIWTAGGVALLRFQVVSAGERLAPLRSRARHALRYVDGTNVAIVVPPRASVWSVADGRSVVSLDGVLDGAVDPVTGALACLHSDGTVRLHPLGGAAPETLLTGVPVAAPVAAPGSASAPRFRLAFARGGESIAVLGPSATRLWDRAGTLLRTLPGAAARHDVALFTADGRLVMVADRERLLIGARDPEHDAALPYEKEGLGGVGVAPDGLTVASGHLGSVYLHDVDGTVRSSFPAAGSAVGAVRFLPDGRHLVTTGDKFFEASDTRVRLWEIHPRGIAALPGRIVATDDPAAPRRLAVRGRWGVAIIDADGAVTLTTPFRVGDISDESQVTAVAIDRSGRWLALGSQFGAVAVLDRSGEVVIHTRPRATDVTAIALHSVGDRLQCVAWAGSDRVLTVQDAETHQLWTRTLTEPRSALRYRADGTLVASSDRAAAAFGPDGVERGVGRERGARLDGLQVAVVGSRTVELRDAAGETTASVDSGMVFAEPFSVSATRVAVGGFPGIVRVWDANLRELMAFRAGSSWVGGLVLLGGGRRLAVEADGSVRIWSLDPAELLDIADRRLVRDFTSEERSRFGVLLGDSVSEPR